MLQSATWRQKRFASETVQVPWTSHMISMSGPSASRARFTRSTEWASVPSPEPTHIFTARYPPSARKALAQASGVMKAWPLRFGSLIANTTGGRGPAARRCSNPV